MDDFIRANLEGQFGALKQTTANHGLHSFFMNLMEKQLISVVMEQTSGNQSQAAQILGINRNTLRKKIEEYEVKLRKKGKGVKPLHS
ncbi:MAG: Fis family transcriptional regulator [Nitrospinota bacterium]|nr:Fis family transcriptional regulator [Nitrospinota bacterium]